MAVKRTRDERTKGKLKFRFRKGLRRDPVIYVTFNRMLKDEMKQQNKTLLSRKWRK